jgi:hypothetical protein
MKGEKLPDTEESMTKCYGSPNVVNITESVNIRIDPSGCWSRRTLEEYTQNADLVLHKCKQFIVEWKCTFSWWQYRDTSIRVYFDNLKHGQIFNNPDIDCPLSKSIIGGIIIIIIIAVCWCYYRDARRARNKTPYPPIGEEPDIRAPDHNTLFKLLSGISNKWNLIGTALGVNNAFIQSLTRERIDDTMRLSHVLMAWIENDDDVTWENIIGVIEGDIVKSKRTANKMKRYVQEQLSIDVTF